MGASNSKSCRPPVVSDQTGAVIKSPNASKIPKPNTKLSFNENKRNTQIIKSPTASKIPEPGAFLSSKKGNSQIEGVAELGTKYESGVNSAFAEEPEFENDEIPVAKSNAAKVVKASNGSNESNTAKVENVAPPAKSKPFNIIKSSNTTEEKIKKLEMFDDKSIQEVNKDGKTPLQYAIETDNDAIIPLLIQKSEYIDQPDKDGKTALHYAIINNKPDIIKLLLQNGALVDAVDLQDHSAIDYANISPLSENMKKELRNKTLLTQGGGRRRRRKTQRQRKQNQTRKTKSRK
jgi:hypothetical protein